MVVHPSLRGSPRHEAWFVSVDTLTCSAPPNSRIDSYFAPFAPNSARCTSTVRRLNSSNRLTIRSTWLTFVIFRLLDRRFWRGRRFAGLRRSLGAGQGIDQVHELRLGFVPENDEKLFGPGLFVKHHPRLGGHLIGAESLDVIVAVCDLFRREDRLPRTAGTAADDVGYPRVLHWTAKRILSPA